MDGAANRIHDCLDGSGQGEVSKARLPHFEKVSGSFGAVYISGLLETCICPLMLKNPFYCIILVHRLDNPINEKTYGKS